ncbi:MAG: hypothetical protein AAGA70_07470 [Pseudomonadota bacterium]
MPQFRRLVTSGHISALTGAGAVPLFGLNLADRSPYDMAANDRIAADPVAALFGASALPAMAYFTDIRCPICRPFEATLDALQAEMPDLIRVTLDYPVFGDSSANAARALIAAGPELAPRLRARLTRVPAVVDARYIATVLDSLQADPAPVLAGMSAPETEARLALTRALARAFGFLGTPALVLGRTAMLGAQPLPLLRRVASDERERL